MLIFSSSARVKALARENELGKALEAVLVKAQAGSVRSSACKCGTRAKPCQNKGRSVFSIIIRAFGDPMKLFLWQYQAQQSNKNVPATPAKTKK